MHAINEQGHYVAAKEISQEEKAQNAWNQVGEEEKKLDHRILLMTRL